MISCEFVKGIYTKTSVPNKRKTQNGIQVGTMNDDNNQFMSDFLRNFSDNESEESDKSDEDISDFEGFEFGPAMIKKSHNEFEGGRKRDKDMDAEFQGGRRTRSNNFNAEKK